MNDPISIAQQSYETWAAKPHNAKWVRKIDGTPIPNDLVVCIAMAFKDAAPRPEWRCFHCDELFTDPATAREHFGSHEVCEPICCMSPADVREMERELERYRDDDSDKDREFHGMRADHSRALIDEEQKGYDRGLADGRVLAPQDVIDLVVAARIVAFEDQSKEALQALDKASEAFAERVPWENDPDGPDILDEEINSILSDQSPATEADQENIDMFDAAIEKGKQRLAAMKSLGDK